MQILILILAALLAACAGPRHVNPAPNPDSLQEDLQRALDDLDSLRCRKVWSEATRDSVWRCPEACGF